MKTLDKFVLKSYIVPLVMTFLIIMFILLLQFIWLYIDDIAGKGLPLSVVAELLMYGVTTLMPLGLPLTVLLASIMSMGNLAESNELLSMKAAGVSLFRVMRPVSIVVILISISSFFVVNNLVPFAIRKMGTVLYDMKRHKGELIFKNGVFYKNIPNMSIRVDNQHPVTKKLDNILIYDNTRAFTPSTTVADSGYISLSEDKRYLNVTLYNGKTYEKMTREKKNKHPLRRNYYKYQRLSFPIDGFEMTRTEDDLFGNRSNMQDLEALSLAIDSLDSLAITDKVSTTKNFYSTYAFSYDRSIFDTAAKKDTTRKIYVASNTYTVAVEKSIITAALVKSRNALAFITTEGDRLLNVRKNIYKYEADWHRKVALPFSIFIFFLIGAPLGAIIRKGGLGLPIIISVFFFIVYYIISMTGEKMVKEGELVSYIGMWLPVIILLPLGLFITFKAAKDSPLFNVEWYFKYIKKGVDAFINKIKNIFVRKRIIKEID